MALNFWGRGGVPEHDGLRENHPDGARPVAHVGPGHGPSRRHAVPTGGLSGDSRRSVVFPGSVRTARGVRLLGATACVVLALVGVAGCKGIDKSQWSSGSGSTVTPKASPTPVANDMGITAGSSAGSRNATPSTVVVKAANDTCWVVTLDASSRRGCGNATFTDSRGTAAARVTKTKGSGPVVITLETDGQPVDQGSVSTASRYVTVAEPENR